MTLLLITLGAFAATMFGGLFALKFRDKFHLILGFSAGAVVAVAFFDLLPEAINLAVKSYDAGFVTSLVALGFVVYMVFDRFFSLHSHVDECDCENSHHEHIHGNGKISGAGSFGAGSLSLHSFLDGVAIGLSFQVSAAVGIIVAVAVLAHDFSDGINTVSVIVKNGGSHKSALKWLFADALAPVLGILVGSWYVVPEATLGILLSIFAGFFLYIGASDLIPESHHAHPTVWTTVMTVVGIAALYVAIHVAAVW